MKWNHAGLLAVLVAAVTTAAQVSPADACGIKLVIKTSTPHKSVARSSNPSHLLLLGTPPHRLERELSAAGHDVEVEPDAASAKRASYGVVIVDAAQEAEARQKFSGATIIVRSGDVTADIASVENQVARKPVRTDESRPLLAAREGRKPVAAGPVAPSHPVVAAKEPAPAVTPPPPSTPPVKEPAIAATVKEPVVEQPAAKDPPVTTKPAKPAKPTPAIKAEGAFHDEVYFGLGSAAVGRKSALDRAVRWLNASPGLSVVIEGHCDPTGTHEINQVIGQNRADTVRDYLVANGIDASRLEVISYGDTKLKYSRNDPRNRRVAIVPKQ